MGGSKGISENQHSNTVMAKYEDKGRAETLMEDHPITHSLNCVVRQQQ